MATGCGTIDVLNRAPVGAKMVLAVADRKVLLGSPEITSRSVGTAATGDRACGPLSLSGLPFGAAGGVDDMIFEERKLELPSCHDQPWLAMVDPGSWCLGHENTGYANQKDPTNDWLMMVMVKG